MSGDRYVLAARGDWTAPHGAHLDAAVAALELSAPAGVPVVIDTSALTALDTFGAVLLHRLRQHGAADGRAAEVTGLADDYRGLYDAVGRTAVVPPDKPRSRFDVPASLAGVGRSTVEMGREVTGLVDMLGRVGRALVGVARDPRSFRLTSLVHQLDRVAWQAVPIIALITFLIGCIIAQQGFFHFRKFGADQYVVDMVGILVVREIGVLLVAIMVAGRSGSSYTAELGSMKMREEIDAIRTMGLDPVSVLILPRVLALVIALPALTLLGILAALYGGGLVASLYGGMSPEIYMARLREALSMDHLKVGMLKAPFMALVIGIVACAEGLRVKGSAESLGLRTTASVVKAIFLVIVLDGIFAVYFASIGL